MIKKISEGIRYQKLTEAEMKARGILGRLVGVCADFINPTRNGRGYTEELWENVFDSPLMKEKIKNKVCYGELGHPEDRAQIDPEKIAVCLSEQPVKNSKGQLEAVFDILDTPNGRILKTLCDYGSTLGISSRGQGDLITDSQGNEIVDPDTYECECWDVVLIPAVETARLKYVREGLETKKSLTEALQKVFNKENEEGKKVMAETLKDLNININENMNLSEGVAKEIKLSDCTELKTAEQANEVTKKLGAKWCFGEANSFGTNVGSRFFDAFTNNGQKIYVYEDGKNSFAFLVKDNNQAYNMFDINDQPVKGITILQDLAENAKEQGTEVNESVELVEKKNKEEKEDKKDKEEEPVKDVLSDADFGATDTPSEDNILNANENTSTEGGEKSGEATTDGDNIDDLINDLSNDDNADNTDGEDDEEDTRTDEEIFIDYLVDNFTEKQIKKACKALDIDVPDLEDEDDEESDGEEDADAENTDDAEGKEDTNTDENSTDDKSDEDKKDDADDTDDELDEALDKGSKTLVKSLQEALKGKSDLEALVKTLQEQLAVSDAKVNELNEKCEQYVSSITRLATLAKSNKDLQENVNTLTESLNEKNEIINEQSLRISRLAQNAKTKVSESTALNESLNTKTNEVQTLTESLNKIKTESEARINQLNENLTNANKLTESYKTLANEAMNKYISIQANLLGLTSRDIKRKLGKSYTISDVDTVCEELKRYQLNVSKLPFDVNQNVRIKVNEAVDKSYINKEANKQFEDDEVDDSLIGLANIYY